MAFTVWSPVQYGWSLAYTATIAGIGYAIGEKALGLTLPAGFASELAVLRVEGGARVGSEVRPDSGVGAGFPLSFAVMDDPTFNALMVRPSARTEATADHTSAATTLTVDDTTDFASSGTIYTGSNEQITYTGKTATTFTGCTRGVAGFAYPITKGAASSIITDKPRTWRGRHVTLYANPVDPTGYVTGSALTTDGEIIWRGFLTRAPRRRPDGLGWQFEALPLERALSNKLAGATSGKVVDVGGRVRVYKSDKCSLHVSGKDAAGAEQLGGGSGVSLSWHPHKDRTDGDLISTSDAIADHVSKFAAAITDYSAGGDLDGIEAIEEFPGVTPRLWRMWLRLDTNANVVTVRGDGEAYGVAFPWLEMNFPGVGVNAADRIPLNWKFQNNLRHVNGKGGPLPQMLSIQLDKGDPADVPTSGVIKIGESLYSYANADTQSGVLFVGGVKSIDGKPVNVAALIGQTAEVVIEDNDQTLADLVLRAMHTSGETNLRSSTYDKANGLVGYGLDESLIDATEITNVLSAGWLALLKWSATYADRSLVDVVGGLLALSRTALVSAQSRDPTVSNNGVKLTAIHTSFAVSHYRATITDAHLLSAPELLRVLDDGESPTAVVCKPTVANKVVDNITINYSDAAHLAPAVVEFELPDCNREDVALAVKSWGVARFLSEGTAYELGLRVLPWVDARPGDAVRLSSLTFPGGWDWAAGAVGFDGVGVCLGRETVLDDGATFLRVAVGGQSLGRGLCPAAAVSAFAGPAGAPTSIDVGREFYPIMSESLANDGTLRLLHYEPGSGTEGVADAYTFTAATDTGSVCRLTVDTVIGTPTVSTSTSWLTWPETANAGTFQKLFAHDGDGGRWS